ncbi:MAG: alanine racemase [Eubacterium sp.]|nr:alanine racemase [Eubacterium sp.]
MYCRTHAEIDLDNVNFNFDNTRKKLPESVKLLAVIKADAYGHGAVALAKELEKKADFFGVACVDEAMELINAGLTKVPILILGYVSPAEFPVVVKHEIRIPIFSQADAKALSDEAVKQNKNAPFHFCVDTGMSRIGFQVNEESADICKQICSLAGIEAEGIFSHFATADESDLTKAQAQRERFKEFISLLEARGINIPIKHINNSAGIMNFDEYFDMCRIGIILYGLYPSHEVDQSLLDIKPVMTWKTHISHIKLLPAGREISYGGTFKTEKDTLIATIPVGYADGYPRCLSNKGVVIIGKKRFPIVGRVCMDQFMVDITGYNEAKVEDEVILVGGGLSMEEVSEAAYSFNYELPCRVARRVPRIYYKNGQYLKTVKHI